MVLGTLAVRCLESIESKNTSALWGNLPYPMDPGGKCALPMDTGERRLND